MPKREELPMKKGERELLDALKKFYKNDKEKLSNIAEQMRSAGDLSANACENLFQEVRGFTPYSKEELAGIRSKEKSYRAKLVKDHPDYTVEDPCAGDYGTKYRWYDDDDPCLRGYRPVKESRIVEGCGSSSSSDGCGSSGCYSTPKRKISVSRCDDNSSGGCSSSGCYSSPSRSSRGSCGGSSSGCGSSSNDRC